MKTFEEIYAMYEAGDENIDVALSEVDIVDAYHECDKNLAKYYEFKCWLKNIEKLDKSLDPNDL